LIRGLKESVNQHIAVVNNNNRINSINFRNRVIGILQTQVDYINNRNQTIAEANVELDNILASIKELSTSMETDRLNSIESNNRACLN